MHPTVMSLKWLLLVALVALLSIGTGTSAKPRRTTIQARPSPEQLSLLQRLNARYYAVQQDDEDGDDIMEHEEDLANDADEDEDEEEEGDEDEEIKQLDNKELTSNTADA